MRKLFGLLCLLFASTPIWAHTTTIVARPTTVIAKSTKELIIRCEHFDISTSSDLASLILSMRKNVSTSWQQVASITSFKQTPTVFGGNGGFPDGHINSNNHSELNVTWSNPGHEREGQYICTSTLIGKTGIPLKESAVLTITVNDVDPIMQLQLKLNETEDKLRKSQTELNKTKNSLISSKTELNKNNVRLNHSETELNQTKIKLTETKLNLDMCSLAANASKPPNDTLAQVRAAHKSIFWFEKVYKGRRYGIADLRPMNMKSAQSVCRMFGGYLVEFNTADEFNYITTEVNRYEWFMATPYNLLIGISDEQKEGTWKNLHNPQDSTYLHWMKLKFEPTGGKSKNCAMLGKLSYWYMFTVNCNGYLAGVGDIPGWFMCEDIKY